MKNLLIHIGYHKTGTTWLQKELFVIESNVFEPISRYYPHKSTLGFKFVYDEDNYLLSPFDDNKKNIRKELLHLLKDKKNCEEKVFVISNERLCGHYQSGGFDAKIIAQRLFSFFPSAKIFITIREQKSCILAQYFQYLKYGGIEELERYLNNRNHKVPSFAPHFQEYNGLIQEYQKLFGKNNVLILPYEMLLTKPNKYIKHLGQFINRKIEIQPSKFKIRHNEKRNYWSIYHLKWLNKFRFRNVNNNYSECNNGLLKFISNKLYSLSHRLVSAKMNTLLVNRLKNFIEEWVGERYKKSNEELSELIGIDLKSYGYF